MSFTYTTAKETFTLEETIVLLPVASDGSCRYGETELYFIRYPRLREYYQELCLDHKLKIGTTKAVIFAKRVFVFCVVHTHYTDTPAPGRILSCLNDLEQKVAHGCYDEVRARSPKRTLSFVMYPLGCTTVHALSFTTALVAINASTAAYYWAPSSVDHLTMVVSQDIKEKLDKRYQSQLLASPRECETGPRYTHKPVVIVEAVIADPAHRTTPLTPTTPTPTPTEATTRHDTEEAKPTNSFGKVLTRLFAFVKKG